jgi:gluconolactonase
MMKPVLKPMTLSRRAFIAGTGAALAAAPATPVLAEWEPSQRYPDPAIQVLDPKFERLHIFSTAVERLATGLRWCEGPVWFGDGRYLLWSDIPNNRIMKWEEASGQVSVFRQPSNYANGNCRDRAGRLISCEHGTRRISRTEYDGTVTTVCDRYDGKRLNSPNDVTTHSDGSVWFTDPPFGIAGNYIGDQQAEELPSYVYRVDGASGKVTVVADDFVRPNGICFSPDEKRLYIAESRGNPNRLIKVYDVIEGGTRLANGRVFVDGGAPERPTAFAATSPAISGAGGAPGARSSTASWCSPPKASRSCASACPRFAPTSASAAPSATGCS